MTITIARGQTQYKLHEMHDILYMHGVFELDNLIYLLKLSLGRDSTGSGGKKKVGLHVSKLWGVE